MPVISAREKDTLTEHICRGLKEVKQIIDGKAKGYSVDELLNEL